MGRPTASGLVRRNTITVRLTDPGKQRLDELRGSMSVGDYIRMLLTQESKRQGLRPQQRRA